MSARTLPHNRAADIGRGLLSLAGVAALVVGVPLALIAWVGSPLPAGVPSVSDVTDALRDTYIPDEFLVKALALVCWVVWFELTVRGKARRQREGRATREIDEDIRPCS